MIMLQTLINKLIDRDNVFLKEILQLGFAELI